jgi:hypothetical protein
MIFFVALPLCVAIPMWICMSISANNRAKKLARALHSQAVADAELVKQVAHLPNSGVTALDVARADQLLEREKRDTGAAQLQHWLALGFVVALFVFLGVTSHKPDDAAPAAPAAPSPATYVTSSNVSSSTPDSSTSETQKHWDAIWAARAAEQAAATATPAPSPQPVASPVVKHHHKHAADHER